MVLESIAGYYWNINAVKLSCTYCICSIFFCECLLTIALLGNLCIDLRFQGKALTVRDIQMEVEMKLKQLTHGYVEG